MSDVIRTINDIDVLFDARPGTSDEIVIAEVWDDDTYQWPSAIMPGAQVLDLGANCGAFALWAAVCGAEHVRAVEPEPGNFAALAANVAANRRLAGRIEIVNAAAGPKGTALVHLGAIPSGSWTGPAGGGVEVPQLPLAELINGMGDSVSVKMDIEGAEYALIADTDPETFRRIIRIALEFHQPPMEAGGGVDRPWFDAPGCFGTMVEHLTTMFKVHTHGMASTGGRVWADRY